MKNLKTKKKSESTKTKKFVDLHVSPSKAYLATQCFEWSKIKSGNRLLPAPKSAQSGTDKHAKIEKDISIVKNWLPENYEAKTVLQEVAVETEIKHNGYKLLVKGVVDCLIIDGKTLYVYDWKTGGSQVEDISEEQLILYAIAAMRCYPMNYEKIELIYVNPDMNSSMTRNFTPDEILEKVHLIIEAIAKKAEESFTVGSHCNYCPAKSACPELKKQMELLINPEVAGKRIELFTEKELDTIKLVESVAQEIKQRMITYLTLSPDKSLHGYILANRNGVRVLSNTADLNVVAEKLGVKVDDILSRDALSVKKLEDRGYDVNSIKEYIFQPTSKVLKKI